MSGLHSAMRRSVTTRLLLLLAFLCHFVANCGRHSIAIDTKAVGANDALGDFVATDEWRPVAPGQRIPPGLHVRMNIQTGETEARLMQQPDVDDASGKNLPVLVNSSPPSDGGGGGGDVEAAAAGDRLRRAFTSREVKEALKRIKAEPLASREDGGGDQPKFRSYAELRADFAKLNANVQTDLEILRGLLADWAKPDSDHDEEQQQQGRRLRILGELEYHLRQIDNGQNFVLLGGLELLMGVVNATLASGAAEVAPASSPALAAAALRALAASCQGNSPVQVAAVRAGFLPVLLRLLERSGDGQLRSLGVLALASVCRNFPHAQAVLLKSGGLSALRSAFLARDCDRQRALRIVTLLADMATEAAAETAAAAAAAGTDGGTERARQYQQIGTARAIAETGWCQLVTRLLPSADGVDADADGGGHDAVEKTAVAMATLADACGAEFAADAGAASALAKLAGRYATLAAAELAEEAGQPGYFCQLRDRIDHLRERLSRLATADRTEL